MSIPTPADDRSAGRPAHGRGHVLIIEDNDVTLRRMATLVRALGCDVTEASDGIDALKHATRGAYDAILLDLVLPQMDGWRFREAQLRRPELARIPTVVVTAMALAAPARYALRTAHVIRKPFEDAELIDMLQHAWLDRPRAAPRPEADARRDPDPQTLFWSGRGAIACALHAPVAGTTQWKEERWCAMPTGPFGRRIIYQCQHCSESGSPIGHARRYD